MFSFVSYSQSVRVLSKPFGSELIKNKGKAFAATGLTVVHAYAKKGTEKVSIRRVCDV